MSKLDEIKRIKDLLDGGFITQEEFEKLKGQILGVPLDSSHNTKENPNSSDPKPQLIIKEYREAFQKRREDEKNKVDNVIDDYKSRTKYLADSLGKNTEAGSENENKNEIKEQDNQLLIGGILLLILVLSIGSFIYFNNYYQSNKSDNLNGGNNISQSNNSQENTSGSKAAENMSVDTAAASAIMVDTARDDRQEKGKADLLGWWPFNDNAHDESGNSHNGITNDLTLTPDRSGNQNAAFSFNGTTSYIGIPTIDVSAGNKLTISVWINPTNITSNLHYHIMRQDNGASNPDWLLAFQDYGRHLTFGLHSGGNYSELDIPIIASDYTDDWHNIVAVYDGASRFVYRDGALIGSDSKTGNVFYTSSATFAFGAASASSGAAEKFIGKIDDIKIWSSALTPAEITSLYESNNLGNGGYENSN